jgi:hypothetical protein
MPNRTADLIRYFLTKMPGAGRTQIVRFLYLADLAARQCLGRPLSPLQYIWHHHGPFSGEILDQLDSMVRGGVVDAQPINYLGSTCTKYQVAETSWCPTFPTTDEVILKHVTDTIGVNGFRDVLEDIVYETKPMLDAQQRKAFGQPLRMELADNVGRIPGLELEEVLQAIKDLDEGKGQPLEEALAELES